MATTQQPLSSIAEQWVVKDGKIRPVNPYDQYYSYVFKQCQQIWNEQNASVEFTTGLPNGIYPVGKLAEPVWQYMTLKGFNKIWVSIDKNEFRSFSDFYTSCPLPTRQFVTTLNTTNK